MAKDEENSIHSHCEVFFVAELREIKDALKSLDESIRGNGKEGIIARLTKTETIQKILLWVVAVQATAVIGLVFKLVGGAIAAH
ncbi:hypothetical protein LCGC14_0856110 [marine sediment metagenome]|uniref:Transmembrane protein n=1 Tax=marine sediment metagenome TaxID=412755 RepID=A0A0F9RTF0_9ZZZZ